MDRLKKIKEHLTAFLQDEREDGKVQTKQTGGSVAVDYLDEDGGRNPPTHWNGWGYDVREA